MTQGPHGTSDELWDGVALLVGRVVIEASRLEFVAAGAMYALLASQVGSAVTTGQSWSFVYQSSLKLIETRERLVRATGGDVTPYPAMRTTFERANKLMDQRNEVVHGFWFPAGENPDGLPQTALQKRSGPPRMSKWSPDQLAQLRTDIRASVEQLGALMGRLAQLHPVAAH
ncbi:hypothetical protein [Jatrophihabitans sp. GAS493]|uniref:hypothetical protein n=1 Tax=Jatrophihabitans sp. GAS493 TaxID=1907575 RepID=UPI000BB6CFA9|nr:hypothetical protein [Jatrophihabitans sp. GAS493]